MADKFSLDARGRILRNAPGGGVPAGIAQAAAVVYNLSAAERAEILARSETDPIRMAYLARPDAGGGSGPAISGVAYDSSGRVTSYVRNGVAVTVTYPSSTQTVLTPSDGTAARTVTFDGSGRVSAISS